MCVCVCKHHSESVNGWCVPWTGFFSTLTFFARLTRLLLIWHIERTIALLNTATDYGEKYANKMYKCFEPKCEWWHCIKRPVGECPAWHAGTFDANINRFHYWKQSKTKRKKWRRQNGWALNFIEWHIGQTHVPFAFGYTHRRVCGVRAVWWVRAYSFIYDLFSCRPIKSSTKNQSHDETENERKKNIPIVFNQSTTMKRKINEMKNTKSNSSAITWCAGS